MDKAQLKIILLSMLFIIFLSLLIYAVSTTLLTPIDQATDDDSFLDLRGSCTPASSSYDGTTSWNITNATLYITSSNGSGTGWFRNVTLQDTTPNANATYHFNFTNFVNFTSEGTYKWNIECEEQNASNGANITKSFAANNTLTVTYAKATVTAEPADNFVDLDSDEVNFTATATPSTKWNITRIELWTNTTGTWHANQSYIRVSALSENIFANFSIDNISNTLSDGTVFMWSIATTQKLNLTHNETVNGRQEINKTSFLVNRTFHIERPPNITLIAPATGIWQTGANSLLNFTVSSSFTSATGFTCQLLTNETGTWNVKSSFQSTNATYKNLNYQFENGLSDIRWGVFCHENADSRVGNFSVNNTVRVDRTNPIPSISLINLSSPVNNSFFNSGRLIINYSLSDSYRNTCDLYVNNTLNATNSAGVAAGNLIFNSSDGVFVLSLGCNDTAGNYVNESKTYYINVDTVYPTYSGINNRSVSGSAHQRLFNITLSELSNLTIYYGTTTATTSSQGNRTFQLHQNITISNFAQNTVHYFNLTACDRAGNCNSSGESLGQSSFTFPYKLLAGWSYYGVYDVRINFSRILNETEAEFVYYWNDTAQKWVSAQAGVTANFGFEVGTGVGERADGGRHVVTIFESTNSTWELRNTSSATSYKYNLTTGDNFVKLINLYTLGNFSRTFLNTSYEDGTTQNAGYEFGIEISSTPGNITKTGADPPGEAGIMGRLPYNLTDFFFSAYNNTGVTWEPYYVYNSTINNGTLLTPRVAGDYGNFDVMWVFSRFNLTKNETNIIGNWTY